ncbi:MAG TPA: biotin/lipoyl-containing protein [Conexibacter sp.]|nr:biotin/lipoyl-containing protein [Conexibacter sp.]
MIDVHVPKMGMTTVEVGIVAVHVKPGDVVAPGDDLVDVEGDKATFTIEAEVGGTVAEVLVAEGDEREVGDVVVRLEESAA